MTPIPETNCTDRGHFLTMIETVNLQGERLAIRDLGLVDYTEAYGLQKECVERVLQGEPEMLLLCEHPAVLTLGRLAKEEHILCPREEINKKGVKVYPIDRGGEVTLHSPGQLVAYPILDLKRHGKDLKLYLYNLEQVAIDFLGDFGIVASRISGKTGVWVGSDKIASLGVGVRKWVSYHGIAVNINTDLGLFALIRPCGLDVAMTSLAKIKGGAVDLAEAKPRFIKAFMNVFGFKEIFA